MPTCTFFGDAMHSSEIELPAVKYPKKCFVAIWKLNLQRLLEILDIFLRRAGTHQIGPIRLDSL